MNDDTNDDIEAALRRLDRPLRSERSAERRRIVLDEFDRTLGRHDQYDVGISIDSAAVADSTTDRSRKPVWALVAASILLIVGLVALTRPQADPVRPATSVVVPPAADPVATIVVTFCDDEFPELVTTLDRYGEGELGAGGNVVPLKDAVVGPVGTLLDDLTRAGASSDTIAALRADLDALSESFLPVQVQTRVANLQADLAAFFDTVALPDPSACDLPPFRTS